MREVSIKTVLLKVYCAFRFNLFQCKHLITSLTCINILKFDKPWFILTNLVTGCGSLLTSSVPPFEGTLPSDPSVGIFCTNGQSCWDSVTRRFARLRIVMASSSCSVPWPALLVYRARHPSRCSYADKWVLGANRYSRRCWASI